MKWERENRWGKHDKPGGDIVGETRLEKVRVTDNHFKQEDFSGAAKKRKLQNE